MRFIWKPQPLTSKCLRYRLGLTIKSKLGLETVWERAFHSHLIHPSCWHAQHLEWIGGLYSLLPIYHVSQRVVSLQDLSSRSLQNRPRSIYPGVPRTCFPLTHKGFSGHVLPVPFLYTHMFQWLFFLQPRPGSRGQESECSQSAHMANHLKLSPHCITGGPWTSGSDIPPPPSSTVWNVLPNVSRGGKNTT